MLAPPGYRPTEEQSVATIEERELSRAAVAAVKAHSALDWAEQTRWQIEQKRDAALLAIERAKASVVLAEQRAEVAQQKLDRAESLYQAARQKAADTVVAKRAAEAAVLKADEADPDA